MLLFNKAQQYMFTDLTMTSIVVLFTLTVISIDALESEMAKESHFVGITELASNVLTA